MHVAHNRRATSILHHSFLIPGCLLSSCSGPVQDRHEWIKEHRRRQALSRVTAPQMRYTTLPQHSHISTLLAMARNRIAGEMDTASRRLDISYGSKRHPQASLCTRRASHTEHVLPSIVYWSFCQSVSDPASIQPECCVGLPADRWPCGPIPRGQTLSNREHADSVMAVIPSDRGNKHLSTAIGHCRLQRQQLDCRE
jgi:hypothetical protein